MVGDRLRLWEDCVGIVVCSMDDDEYTPAFPRDHWAYLGSGVLIDCDLAGLIHYTTPEDSFELIERSTP
jgi:hypothetical protein